MGQEFFLADFFDFLAKLMSCHLEDFTDPSPGLKATFPMNLWHALTPSLSPSEGERVPVGRVRRFMGAMRELVRGNSLPVRWEWGGSTCRGPL
jgi:hypothetical protein